MLTNLDLRKPKVDLKVNPEAKDHSAEGSFARR